MSETNRVERLVRQNRARIEHTLEFCAAIKRQRREWQERVDAAIIAQSEELLRGAALALTDADKWTEAIYAEWHGVFDVVPLPLVVAEKSGRIRELNAAARRLFGDVERHILEGLVAPRHIVRFREAIASTAGDLDIVLAITCAGRREQLVTLSRRLIAGTGHVLWCPRIDTAPAHAAGELEGVVAELARERVECERMRAADAAKDRLLSVVSHDSRSPVNAVLGWTQLLRSGRLDMRQRETALQTIERNARAQGELIAAMLDVSRMRAGKVTVRRDPIDAREVLSAIVEAVTPAAEEKHVELTYVPTNDVVCVQADASRLRQALANIVGNALKFTPSGGAVLVAIDIEEGEAVIRVKDTGCGVAREDIERLFDWCRQSPSAHAEGLGVGLYVAREMIEANGGKIEAASEGRDRGTTFTVKLPIARSLPVAASSALLPATDDPLTGIKILVVDDDEDTRVVLGTILEQFGATVATAADSTHAVHIFRSFAPDIVIADIGLPDADGYELVKRLRQCQSRHVPAVAVTGFASEADARRALRAGFDAHIAKPVSATEIVNTVERLAKRTH